MFSVLSFRNFGISSGRAIRAAQILGAVYAYLGTRFIVSHESMAEAAYKQMVVDSTGADIVCSDALTGVKAHWLRASLEAAGYDPANMPPPGDIDIVSSAGDARRWKEVWAAGQGVGAINKIQSVQQIVDQ
ncbi:MAG: nitronate monooxygenase, partial [Pseudomonadota bacterium]